MERLANFVGAALIMTGVNIGLIELFLGLALTL